jgi:phosphoribosylaminoimidazolecarboxamide formyltransferase / IMP cyclohydrolase
VSHLQIKNALLSVYYKDGLEVLLDVLASEKIRMMSTGGTADFIKSRGLTVDLVEDLTGFPSILGGRVKTLHPHIFGGILHRREHQEDLHQVATYHIPPIDLVVVDLYPFEETLASGAEEQDIIEKIDIGGVSLIRAAAKNYKEVAIICDKADYGWVADNIKNGTLDLEARKQLARKAFALTSAYDEMIGDYFGGSSRQELRYGENPHQKGYFVGQLEDHFTRIQGKEISFNNLLDIESALALMGEFDTALGSTFAIIKHNNACGIATRDTVCSSYEAALSSDPLSAFGGIMICNHPIDMDTALKINDIFFEILMAPSFADGVLDLFKKKSNRTLLQTRSYHMLGVQRRSLLNGYLIQDRDTLTEGRSSFRVVTEANPDDRMLDDFEFALKVVKHTKSNAIVLVKDHMMISSGTGQTSRVDALNQAIEKAGRFGFDINGCVMASDAFFPFPDCVEIGVAAGVKGIIQPGGSLKDEWSIAAANRGGVVMVTTGNRHFKH